MTKICKIGGGGLFSWGGGGLFYRGLLTMDENMAYHVSLSVNLSGKSKTKHVWSFFSQFEKYQLGHFQAGHFLKIFLAFWTF